MELRHTVIRFGLIAGIAGSALLLGACRGPGSGGDEPTPTVTTTVRAATTARTMTTARPATNLPPTTPVAAPGGATTPTATAAAPVAQPTATPRTGTSSGERYTVQPGDTLAAIAAEYGVTVESIIEANILQNPDLLSVGQVLIIPNP